MTGSTLGATAEPGEAVFSLDPSGPINSIWFSWTAYNVRGAHIAMLVVGGGPVSSVSVLVVRFALVWRGVVSCALCCDRTCTFHT